jgi:hypothetical protein
MNPMPKPFSTPRVLLGISAVAALAILLSFFMRITGLASLPGMLLAASIANLERPKEFAILGFATGSMIRLYLNLRYLLFVGELRSFAQLVGLIAGVIVSLLLSGLLCMAYGWIIGKILTLYRQGRRPFF